MIDLLEKMFQTHELVKIAVLKSATRNRDELRKIAREICSELMKRFKKEFTFRIVGFTIFMRKWRRGAK
jgi:RNA-binding protein YhbY